MKIFRNVFMVAAALMMGLASCNNEGNDPVEIGNGDVTVEGSSIRFAISLPGQTKLAGPTQQTVPVAVTSGWIVFSDGATIQHPPVAATISQVFDTSPTGGQTITNLPGGITQVHFVGNTDIAGLNIVRGTALTTLTDHLVTVGSQMMTVNNAPAPGQLGNNVVNVWGYTPTLTPAGTNTATGNPLFTATIALEPTVARVEIFNVTGNTAIAGFTLQGIFVDNFYTHGRVAGGGGLQHWRTLGDDPAASNFLATAPVYTPFLAGSVFDAPIGIASGPVTTTIPGNAAPSILQRVSTPEVVADVHNVWGYNLFANNSRTPRIAIRLSGVTVNSTVTTTYEWYNPGTNLTETLTATGTAVVPHPLNAVVDNTWTPHTAQQLEGLFALYAAAPHNLEGQLLVNAVNAARITHLQARASVDANAPMFISIRGFRHNGVSINRDTGFQPRHVYQLGSYTLHGAADGSFWTFGPEDIDEIPFRRDIDVNVTVTIQNWINHPVEPEL